MKGLEGVEGLLGIGKNNSLRGGRIWNFNFITNCVNFKSKSLANFL